MHSYSVFKFRPMQFNARFLLYPGIYSHRSSKVFSFLSKANFVFILFTYFYLCQPLAKLLINSSFPGKAKKVGGDSFASCYPVLAYHPPFAYKINKNISKTRQTYLFFFFNFCIFYATYK